MEKEEEEEEEEEEEQGDEEDLFVFNDTNADTSAHSCSSYTKPLYGALFYFLSPPKICTCWPCREQTQILKKCFV